MDKKQKEKIFTDAAKEILDGIKNNTLTEEEGIEIVKNTLEKISE